MPYFAPVPPLGIVSNAAAVAAAITDYSPQETVLWPGAQMQQGTRLRIRATGSYVTSAATATVIWGFYMTNAGSALSASSAVIAATAALTVANTGSAAWPWTMEWEGHFRALSTAASGSTNGQLFGQGKRWEPTSLTALVASAIPVTAALRTVQQVAGGLNTNLGQMISVGATPNVTTALTTITCDELTVETSVAI